MTVYESNTSESAKESASVAQRIRHRSPKPGIAGSNPAGGKTALFFSLNSMSTHLWHGIFSSLVLSYPLIQDYLGIMDALFIINPPPRHSLLLHILRHVSILIGHTKAIHGGSCRRTQSGCNVSAESDCASYRKPHFPHPVHQSTQFLFPAFPLLSQPSPRRGGSIKKIRA